VLVRRDDRTRDSPAPRQSSSSTHFSSSRPCSVEAARYTRLLSTEGLHLPARSDEPSGLSILVVDDSLTVRLGLRDALAGASFRVEVASSNAEARELLDRGKYAFVVLDLHLTDGDSTPLLLHLVSSYYRRPGSVLVLSGTDALETRVEMLRLGADFIAKPYDVRFLKHRVRRMLGLPMVAGEGRDRPQRVLLVDDSTTYAHALASELRKDGHDVVIAATGAEAVKYLKLQGPDCVLLDVFLPDTDGVELAKRVRAFPEARLLPLLMLTGRENANVRRRAAEAGVAHFMTKDSSLGRIRAWVGQPFRTDFAAAAPPVEAPSAQLGTQRGSANLFGQLLLASGLSKILGRSTLELALRRAGTDPDSLTPEALRGALVQIEQTLTTFLPETEVHTRMLSITQLAQEVSKDVSVTK
jgi:DNA-binding response OmpR family regulator